MEFSSQRANFPFTDGPSSNLRKRGEVAAAETIDRMLSPDLSTMMQLPPTPGTPQRTTRSAKRLNPACMEDFFEMGAKQTKFYPDMAIQIPPEHDDHVANLLNSMPYQSIPFNSNSGFRVEDFLDFEASTPEKRQSKRLLEALENEIETPEKKKLCLDQLNGPCSELLQSDNRGPVTRRHHGHAPNYSFNLDSLIESETPYALRVETDDTESLNTPHVSPYNTPLPSPMTTEASPMTPQIVITPNATPQRIIPSRGSERIPDDNDVSSYTSEIVEVNDYEEEEDETMQDLNYEEDLALDPEEAEGAENLFMRDGIIKELRLSNFMNHGCFEWKFSPHMNMILGRNGSGKSAIQNAIMFALGATAIMTERKSTKSLQDYIKKNQNQAKIEIRLTNYNGTVSQKKYGNEIVISKVIRKSGGPTTHLIVNGEKRLISKRDLDLIMKPLQIHISNPFQILTQEKAKNICQSSEPSQLYKNFCDAMLITDSKKCYDEAQENVQITLKKIENTEQKRLEFERKAKRKKEEYKKILEMEKHKVKVINLESELAWSHVIEMEESLAEVESQLEELDQNVASTQAKRDRSEEEMDKLIQGLKSGGSELKGLERERDKLDAEYKEIRRSNHALTVENNSYKKNIRVAEELIAKDTRELEEMKRKIEDSITNKANNPDRKKQEAEKRIQNYMEKIDVGSKQLDELKRTKSKHEETLDLCQRTEHEHFSHLKMLQSGLSDKKKELNKIKLTQSTKYDRFGPTMKKLVQRIEQTSWSTGRPPYGPIGSCFTVKDAEWLQVTEHIMKPSLSAFFVNNKTDYHAVRKLIIDMYKNDNYRKATVTYIPFNPDKPINVKKTFLEGYKTLYDILDLRDPIVSRVLMDSHDIEKTILFPTYHEACNIFKDQETVPMHCLVGFTKDWLKVNPAPNYAFWTIKPNKSKDTILQTAKFDNTSQVEDQIQKYQSEVAQVSRLHKLAQDNTLGVREVLKRVDKEIKKKNDEVNHWKSELRTCSEALRSINNTSDVATHNDWIEERREWISTKTTELDELRSKLHANETILGRKTGAIKEFDRKLSDLQENIKTCTGEADSIHKKCEELKKITKTCENSLDKLNSKHDATQKRIGQLKEQLDSRIKVAESKGDRIVTKRTSNEIKADLDIRKTFYEQNLSKIKEKDLVWAEYRQSEVKAREIAKEVAGIRSCLKVLLSLMKHLTEHLEKKKREYGLSLQNYYKALIERKKGQSGHIEFDWENEGLTYSARMNEDENTEALSRSLFKENWNRETRGSDRKRLKDHNKNLSGGERSLATFCFVTALRQTMPAPFFMMDEYDVNMDASKRKFCQDITLEQARNQLDAQFFVLTPQERFQLPPDDKILKVLELPLRTEVTKKAKVKRRADPTLST